ncbi:MAG: hypothetical protein NTU53_21610 [Planctomycetota bacterium]|nr:hypothetical protein [Planctomycetota bacterium]
MSRTVLSYETHPALLDLLVGVRRKVRVLSVLFGLGVVVALTVGAAMAVAVLDYLLNLPKWPRMVFVLAAVGGVGYAAWKYVGRALLSRLSLGDVAGRLENAFPQFDDRLRSTIDFVKTDLPGSPVMKQRVVGEAQQLAVAVDLNSALLFRPVLYSLGLGLAAVVLAVVLAMSYLDLARIAMSRLMIVNGANWPKRVQIDVMKGVPAKIAAGQRFDLKMRLAKGDRANLKAIVFYRYDNGRTQEQLMARNADGTYSVFVDAKGNAMTVWMKAGDDATDPCTVNVVQRLAIRNVNLKVMPPAYAKMEPITVNLGETPAVVTAGSVLELQVTFNKPLAADKPVMLEMVKAETKSPQITWAVASAGTVIGRWTAEQTLRFRIRAMDGDYFENPGLEEYEIVVRPDQNPAVIIENPTRNEDRTAVAVVKLEAMAEDDFDIKTMTLVVDRRADNQHWEIPLTGASRVDSSGDRRRFRVKFDWELSQLQGASLKAGDVLEYCVRVTDNYDLGGKLHDPQFSGRLKINIISEEMLATQVTDAIRAIAQKVRPVQAAQTRNRQETQALRQDTRNKPRLDAGDRTALLRLTDQQSTLASQTKQLAAQMAAQERRLEENRSTSAELKDIAKDVRSTLNDTAEKPMSEASKKLSEAGQTPDPKQDAKQQAEQRSESLQGSETRQQQASEQLAKAMEKMGNLGTFETMLQKVREALEQQRELSRKLAEAGKQTLGKKPEELTAEQKRNLENVANEQKKAAENTEKLTKDLAKAADQTQKNDPASSNAMKQASQQSQQQQVSSNQSQASQAAQQNQQAQAQAKQKQAEIGLQMMLNTLREAERRKLEQLSKELAKLQELIANLVRRQAGHNIDNLRIQNLPDALKLITDELVAKAERATDKMPAKPEPPQLGNSQAQTERNTRDVSKTAEETRKGGAEIATALTKAAGFMERAIVSIREPNLPAAYDPSQVRALAALDEARQKTDEAAAEVAKQQEEADKETLRQAYEKIKADQEKINTETTRIDASQRLPDGTLRREEAVRLGKLPGDQGSLSDRAKALDEDLSKLGSIVYVWANQDVVSSMNEVKGDLGNSKTGKPTQAEQTRIVEQLDAMIRNLAVKPEQKEFNQPPGGGGGGGGAAKAKLPTEVELRLLKELQLAVNKSTKTIDALAEKDKQKLLTLGGRQGEMRGLLDQLIQKASEGKLKLDAEPDPKDRLPEEASNAQIENQELDEWLRGAKSSDDQAANDVKMAGQRMARSRQRLALDNDPGKTTQKIQERIVMNLDNLIQLARQQQAQAKPGSGKGQPQQAMKPQNNGAQEKGESQPNQSTTPANSEKLSAGGNNTADTSKDIRETASEWGHLTPRDRQAVIEGTHETVIAKYKKITDDYYEAMGKKGSEQR